MGLPTSEDDARAFLETKVVSIVAESCGRLPIASRVMAVMHPVGAAQTYETIIGVTVISSWTLLMSYPKAAAVVHMVRWRHIMTQTTAFSL